MATMKEIFASYEARRSILSCISNPFAKGVAWIPAISDLTYDVPAVWDGRFFRLSDHLTRLEASCKKLRLHPPLPRQEIKDILIDMVARSGIRDAFVELIVTRGMRQVRGSTPEQLRDNSLYMFIQPYVWVMEPSVQLSGGKAVVTRSVRRTPPGSMDLTVKNLQWGDLTRGLFEAADRSAMYPFLTDGDANTTEGSGYNIVFVKDGVLYTADRGVLEGITRKTVFDIARKKGIGVRVQVVPVELAYAADEIFMCTTAGGIMLIVYLDGSPVKSGEIGPVTKEIWDAYWAMHYDPAYTFEVQYAQSETKLSAKL